jgi:hypothetical protein
LVLELLAIPSDLFFDPELTFQIQRLYSLKSLLRSFRKELNLVEEGGVEVRLLGQASSCCIKWCRLLFTTSSSTVLTARCKIVQQLIKVDRCRCTDRGREALKGGRSAIVAVVKGGRVLSLGVVL